MDIFLCGRKREIGVDNIEYRYYTELKIIEYRYKGGGTLAREKFGTLTEQMFYVLLVLRDECCGMDVMARVSALTDRRVAVGPGTLYNLLEQFAAAGYIVETRAEGRRRSYRLTPAGETLLQNEVERLQMQVRDYQKLLRGGSIL